MNSERVRLPPVVSFDINMTPGKGNDVLAIVCIYSSGGLEQWGWTSEEIQKEGGSVSYLILKTICYITAREGIPRVVVDSAVHTALSNRLEDGCISFLPIANERGSHWIPIHDAESVQLGFIGSMSATVEEKEEAKLKEMLKDDYIEPFSSYELCTMKSPLNRCASRVAKMHRAILKYCSEH